MRQRLPEFIGVGPPRTATTWLHKVLSGHVGLPRGVKETQFFDRHYSLGMEWYLRHFRDWPANRPCGEFSPTYFASAEARMRIAADVRKPTGSGNMFNVNRYAYHVRACQGAMRAGNVRVFLCDDLEADPEK